VRPAIAAQAFKNKTNDIYIYIYIYKTYDSLLKDILTWYAFEKAYASKALRGLMLEQTSVAKSMKLEPRADYRGPEVWRSQRVGLIIGTPYIYTTSGFGPRKNGKMAGV